MAFSAAALSEMAPDSQLVKVIYKEELQEEILTAVLDELSPELIAMSEPKETNEEFFTQALLTILIVLINFFQILKHPDYEVENEWRLISSGLMSQKGKEIRFETIGNRVRPIVAVELDPPSKYIKEIKIGPGTDENLIEIVNLIIYKYYGETSEMIRINSSATPLRH